LIGVKGNPTYNKNVKFDLIFSRRRGQSQKPEEVYDLVESLIPNGYYLEIFGRRNNLRDYWVTIGNEI
jgi:mRNA (2'-O-methyladenosine-N6-)-methyltransferase